MPKPSKIEQHGLEKDVLDWTSQGMSSRDISAKIMEEKKIYISTPPLYLSFKSVREERSRNIEGDSPGAHAEDSSRRPRTAG